LLSLIAVCGARCTACGYRNFTILPDENIGDPFIMKYNGAFYLVLSKNSRFRLELTRIRRYTQVYASP
jgi:hypothetical protein